MHQINIRIPDKIYRKLSKLSEKTGYTKTHFVKEAVMEHMEDLEDTYLSLKALKAHKKSGKTYRLETVEKLLGLDH